MRFFIYEHTCAATTTDAPELASLRKEGQAMRAAVVEDFARLDDVEVATLDDSSEAAFRNAAERAAFTLVIAPEFDGILETRCRWVEECGGRLLGSSSAAVRLAADKLTLGQHWLRQGVPTPSVQLLLSGLAPADILFPAVCKPRYGAGSQATFLVRVAADLSAAVAHARHEGYRDELLVQSFLPGRAVSVAWLVGPRQQLPLAPAAQDLSPDGRFRYLGGVLPLAAELAERAIALSRRAIESVPGLLGYAGVDLILGDASDGSRDGVIELNPRLTTSYIGLRVLARNNLAQLMLQTASGERITPPEWHAKLVRFQADGRVLI